MIVEGVVLRRIEDFEHCARRIAAPIATQFVDFIEYEDGVSDADALNALDNFARHRPDVCAAMAADFGFVFEPTERKPVEFALERTIDRSRQTRLADARRP